MVNAAVRMRALIESILTYSRVTTNAIPFHPVGLETVLSEALSNLEPVIEQKSARVEVGALPVIEADPQQMLQLMQNLIANALRFQKEGVVPEIRITASTVHVPPDAGPVDSGDAGFCELRVEDNGIGFEERYLDRIFAPFQRLHGRGNYEGLGMGLAICRKIVERHGGEITAESEPGNGARFLVRLPLRQEKLE
jgi:signal transduction histidine kinase